VTIAALAAVPPVEVANADAERYFRRALQIDPSLTEAHVRLARLLTVRGRHAEALTEAGAALAAKPDPVVEFLAHMFAARATRALGRLEDAADHYAKARALFPGAQSAAIGASQVALLRADVSGATTAIRQLGGRGSKPDLESDPWWGYRLASGRTSNALLDAMWKMVAQGE
jgi:tetratricopeptide (TPR) repeat protein